MPRYKDKRPEAMGVVGVRLSDRLKINLIAKSEGKTVVALFHEWAEREWKKKEGQLFTPDFFEKIAKDTRIVMSVIKEDKATYKARNKTEIARDLIKALEE